MRISSIKYFFKEGITGLYKNRLMAIAAMGTVAACIFIVSLSICITSNLSNALEQIEETIGVAAFLEEDIDSQKVSDIRDEINNIEYVDMVIYVSPAEALAELKKEWGADDILEGFDGDNNPLSHSFEIDIADIKYQDDVLASLEAIDGISNIRHAQSETEILLNLNNGISIMGFSFVLILAIISVVIIMNTIKASVFTRRNEIGIMKFIGATDWFIRWPFIIEGALIGIIGATIPMMISWPLYNKITSLLYEYFPIIENIVTPVSGSVIFATLIPMSLFFGILIGTVGSVTSIHKHLKV